MLETLRKASKGWLAGIMIFMLLGSFGFAWGVQGWLNFTPTPKIATVGGIDIPPDEFKKEFANYIRKASQSSKLELSTAQAKALGLDRIALDEMLTRKALLAKAKNLDLGVTNDQLIEVLKANLSDGRGGIDSEKLGRILSALQVSEQEFLDLVRSDMLRGQLLRTVTGGTTLPPGLENALHHFRLERRVAEYVVIDPARAGEIKDPDDATLKKYYEAHAGEKYSAPEYRALTVITVKPEDVASRVTVTDEELKTAYERAKKFFETPEKRKIEQIKFKTEEKARAAAAKLAAGQSFDAVAVAEGYKPEDIKLGDVSKNDPTIPAAAFDMPLNKISDPLKGPFGWVILRVLSVTPGSVKPYDQAKEEIRKQFVTERSKNALIDLTNDIEDTLGGGATLEEAAKKHNVPLVKIAATDEQGNDTAGKPVQGLPGGDFLAKAFGADPNSDPEFNETQDNVHYIFRVDKVTPVAKKPLAQVHDQIVADWRAEELNTRLTKLTDDLVKRGNAGQSMASIASSLGVTPQRTDPMERGMPKGVFSEEAVAAGGDIKVGQFFSGPTADGKGRVVARLAAIQYQDEVREDPTRQKAAAALREVFAQDLVDQFSKAVRNEVGVTIDQNELNKFHSNE